MPFIELPFSDFGHYQLSTLLGEVQSKHSGDINEKLTKKERDGL